MSSDFGSNRKFPSALVPPALFYRQPRFVKFEQSFPSHLPTCGQAIYLADARQRQTHRFHLFSPTRPIAMSDPNIPALLCALRKAHRLTQPQMADRMAVEERTYRSWEKGKTSPTMPPLQRLAESFGRSLTELLHVDPETGEFPQPASPEKEGAADRLAVALLNDSSLSATIKDRIVKIWKEVLRGGGGGAE